MRFCPDYKLNILPEETFDVQMDALAEKLESCRTEGYFEGFDGEKLYYEYFLSVGSQGAVVVVHGLSEFTKKYHEFAGYLCNQGYDVFLYDQRCHGRSCRLTDRNDTIHVNKFADYSKDLHCFVEKVVRPATDKTLYIYGHSMGGAVTAMYLADHPETFRKAVISAPMIEPLTGGVNPTVARLGLSLYMIFGDKKKKFWGSKEFDPDFKFENSHDKSRARFERNMRYRWAEECYCTTPMTMGWVLQSLLVCKWTLKKSFMKKLKTPILMICGDTDKVVSMAAQKAFADKCPVCRQVVLPNAAHAMLLGEEQTIYDHVKLTLDHFC